MHRVEPRCIYRAVGPAQRREHRHIRVLFEERHQLLVNVADHVREHVDAGAKQRFRVTGIRGVHGDTQLVRVRLVDDGSVKIGGELLDRAAPVVDPRLDQRDFPRHQFLHGRARAFGRCHRERRLTHVVRADLDKRRQPAACGQKARRVGVLPGEDLVPDLKRQLTEVAPHRLARGNTEVREPVHVVEDVFPRVVGGTTRQVLHVADVRVAVDEGRNDRLAAQIDAGGTRRRRNLAPASDAREPGVLDEKRRVFNRRVAVARDEARAFIQRDA